MFQLGKTIVSEDILEKDFVCNLSACHGACCVDGDAGAPLNEEEIGILETIYPKIKPFLRKEGIEAIERLGTWVVGTDQDMETPLIVSLFNAAKCRFSIKNNIGTIFIVNQWGFHILIGSNNPSS